MGASIWAPGTPANVTVNPTAPVEFLDGTAALPGITNAGDVNTGMYFPGANKVGISTDGVGRLTVDELGNIIADSNKFVCNDEVDVASATTTEIGLATSNFVQITGTNNINSFGTTYKGPLHVRFASSLILAHSTSLILPGGANITVRAGDTCTLIPKATAGVPDGWSVTAYSRSDGTAIAVSQTGAWGSILASTPVTLPSVNTLVKMTPTEYGVSVNLPDARTCVNSLLYLVDCVDSDFPVIVRNHSNEIVGFVFSGVCANIFLTDNSTVAGNWSGVGLELVGCSARFSLTGTSQTILSVCKIDVDRDLILLSNTTTNVYAVVYNKTTNVFGAITLVRTAAIQQDACYALLVSTDKVLVTSCTNGSTAFEAVHLTLVGTVITVGAAAAVVLSGNWTVGAGGVTSALGGCALIAAGNSSFSLLYQIAGPFWQIRAIDASAATPVISTAVVLTGTSYGFQVVGETGVVLTTSLVSAAFAYAAAYTIAGSAAPTTVGAVSMGAIAAGSVNRFMGRFSTGRFWSIFGASGAGNHFGCVVTVTGSTCTVSTVTILTATSIPSHAAVIGTNKVLVTTQDATTQFNLLTDTAGVASAGVAINSGATAGSLAAIMLVVGNIATVQETPQVTTIDCSGASPVAIRYQLLVAVTDFEVPSPTGIHKPTDLSTATFVQRVGVYSTAAPASLRLRSKAAQIITDRREYMMTAVPSGRSPVLSSECWGISVLAGNIGHLYKLECATV